MFFRQRIFAFAMVLAFIQGLTADCACSAFDDSDPPYAAIPGRTAEKAPKQTIFLDSCDLDSSSDPFKSIKFEKAEAHDRLGIINSLLGKWQISCERTGIECSDHELLKKLDVIYPNPKHMAWSISSSKNNVFEISMDFCKFLPVLMETCKDTALFRLQQKGKLTPLEQYAAVMQLKPGSSTFDGIMRIRLVDKDNPIVIQMPNQTVALIKYKLSGKRLD